MKEFYGEILCVGNEGHKESFLVSILTL